MARSIVNVVPHATLVKKPRTWKQNFYRLRERLIGIDVKLPERRNYCRDCNWAASTAEYSIQELGGRAIEHVCETGHDIDSEIIPE